MRSWRRRLKLVCWISLGCLVFNSCVIKKALRTGIIKELDPNQIGYIETKLDSSTYRADSVFVKKLTGSLYAQGKKVDFKGRIYSVDESELLITLSAKIGIEVFRIWMSKDEIRVLDHINKKFYEGDYKGISKKVGYELDLKTIQDILFASNLNFKELSREELKQNAQTAGFHYFYNIEKDDLVCSKFVDPDNYNLLGLEFSKNKEKKLTCIYGYKTKSEFPASISVNLFDSIKTVQSIEFEYQKVSSHFKKKKMKIKNRKYQVVKL